MHTIAAHSRLHRQSSYIKGFHFIILHFQFNAFDSIACRNITRTILLNEQIIFLFSFTRVWKINSAHICGGGWINFQKSLAAYGHYFAHSTLFWMDTMKLYASFFPYDFEEWDRLIDCHQLHNTDSILGSNISI